MHLARPVLLAACAAALSLAFARSAAAQPWSAPPAAASLLATFGVEESARPDYGTLADWVRARRLHAVERSSREAFGLGLSEDPEGQLDEEAIASGLRLEPVLPDDEAEQDLPLGAWLETVAPFGARSSVQTLDAGLGCDLVLGGGSDLQLWERDVWYGAAPLASAPNGHVDKGGKWIDYEQIGRRWDRPEAYAAYRYPVPNGMVASGYDLDRPDGEQRRGKMNAVGHGGVDLVEKMGTPISVVALDHQIGDTLVLYTGPFFGETIITAHARREGARRREYILIFGHLDKVADGIYRGRRLKPGATLGYVGNSDSPDFTHLHLEARRLREGADAWKLGGRILDRDTSIVCDPRNVLPLRIERPHPKCTPRLLPQRQPRWLERMTLSLRTGG